MSKDEIIFAQEDFEEKKDNDSSWSVLIVDDDHEVHVVTKLALHDFEFENKKLNLVSAYSAKEAQEILQGDTKFAFILLDIVMESNIAGLNVVNFIRNELKDKLIRIIIRTGQPGYAPEEEIINLYDINDYKEKTELTSTKLYTTTRTALNQYKQISELEKKKNELYNNLITDSVTSLYSREKLYKDLEKLENVGLILIDIDSFSTINNAYGYDFGDFVLKGLAKLLKKSDLKSQDIYRIEPDNFVILYQNKTNEQLNELALKIKKLVTSENFKINDISMFINISIGISNYPDNNLFQKAEIAINASRQKQDNKIEFYSEELNTIKEINKNLLWSKRLTNAIKLDNIITYYQPIVDCKTLEVVKYETLVRLVYEDEVYSPFYFLDAARNAGLLTQITKIVFEQACKKFQNNKLNFSINITDHDLMQSNFAQIMLDYCKKYNINTNRVSIELLEEQSISSNIQAKKNIKTLKELGFLLSIDDFGVEYSNFSQLKFLDIDNVKIDGSYIKDIHTNQNSKFITQAILSYTKNIKVKTIAEYVHNKEVFEEIKKLGVDYAQGYYFGQPKEELL